MLSLLLSLLASRCDYQINIDEYKPITETFELLSFDNLCVNSTVSNLVLVMISEYPLVTQIYKEKNNSFLLEKITGFTLTSLTPAISFQGVVGSAHFRPMADTFVTLNAFAFPPSCDAQRYVSNLEVDEFYLKRLIQKNKESITGNTACLWYFQSNYSVQFDVLDSSSNTNILSCSTPLDCTRLEYGKKYFTTSPSYHTISVSDSMPEKLVYAKFEGESEDIDADSTFVAASLPMNQVSLLESSYLGQRAFPKQTPVATPKATFDLDKFFHTPPPRVPVIEKDADAKQKKSASLFNPLKVLVLVLILGCVSLAVIAVRMNSSAPEEYDEANERLITSPVSQSNNDLQYPQTYPGYNHPSYFFPPV